MNNKFKGIFPALLTPFDENDRVNTKVLEELVDYNLNKGVDGFYVGGRRDGRRCNTISYSIRIYRF